MKRSYIWAVVALIGAYLVCQAVADVGATKLVRLGSITMPAGTLIFAVTFTLRDLIHKRLGREWARAAIVVAAALNIVQALYLVGMAKLDAPVYYKQAEAWSSIFAIVPAITIGSIVAEVVSELVDTEVYHYVMDRVPSWAAVLISNGISLPLDSLLFGSLAFAFLPLILGGESLPFMTAMDLVKGQIVWKIVVTIGSMPLIYLVRREPEAANTLARCDCL